MDTNQIQGTTEDVTTTQTAEEVNQPESMPNSNQQQTEDASTINPDQNDGEQLPDNASERTREQFKKLLEENRRLKAVKQQESFGASVFDTFHPQREEVIQPQVDARNFNALNQTQVDAVTQQFVDQEGNVDINGLNQALSQANRRAEEAEKQTRTLNDRVTRFEENQQVRDAHAVHAELDPQAENFDPDFFGMVRDRILRNMYEGKSQTLLDVANAIKSKYVSPSPVNLDKVKEEAVAQYKQAQTSRQQGPIESGKGSPRNESTLTELRERSRKGDPRAIDERLRRIGLIETST